jgi:hypothetical protein
MAWPYVGPNCVRPGRALLGRTVFGRGSGALRCPLSAGVRFPETTARAVTSGEKEAAGVKRQGSGAGDLRFQIQAGRSKNGARDGRLEIQDSRFKSGEVNSPLRIRNKRSAQEEALFPGLAEKSHHSRVWGFTGQLRCTSRLSARLSAPARARRCGSSEMSTTD